MVESTMVNADYYLGTTVLSDRKARFSYIYVN